MTIAISGKEHKRLKALAAFLGKSMREIVADWINVSLCSENTFNAETMKAKKRG